MSVRKILYLMLVIMTILPLLLFTVYEYEVINTRMVDVKQHSMQQFAFSEGQELLLLAKEIQADTWASTRTIVHTNTRTSPNQNNEALYEAASEVGFVSSGDHKVTDLFFLEADGTISASADPEFVGINILDTPLHELLETDDFAMSDVMMSQLRPEEQGFWIARRIVGASDTRLAAFISSDIFEDHIARLRLNNTGHAFLMGDNGNLQTDADIGVAGTRLADPQMNGLISGYLNNTLPITNLGELATDTATMVYSYYVLPDIGSVVVVMQDKVEILALNKSFLWDAVFAALLFAMLSIAIAVPFIQKNIIRPIRMLRASMKLAAGGGYFPCEASINNEIGEVVSGFNHMVTTVNQTISNVEKANAALRENEAHLQRDKERIVTSELRAKCATELSTIVVFELASLTDEFFCSDSWETITTYPPMKAFPREYVIQYIVHPDDRAKLLKWMSDTALRFDYDIRFLTTQGDYKWIHISMAEMTDEFTGAGKVVGTITDIHERVMAQEKATYAAYHESLTGLPRRVLFEQDIELRLSNLKGNNWGVVYILSMDDFKGINDIFGFALGDKTIISCASALRENFGDELYLSRNSGNSFLLYMECPRIMSYVHEMADRLLEVFSKPFIVGDLSIDVKVHLGAAMYPEHGRNVYSLMRSADIAMHEARNNDRSGEYAIFGSDMLHKVERIHQVMEVLRNFEKSKALYIQYQPLIRAKDGTLLGFEALVRMDSTPIGSVSPVEFIPLAEKSKIIIPMGTAVLRESCLCARRLMDANIEFHHMSVNVSSVQLKEPNFADVVMEILAETQLPNDKLQLEVTESLMIDNLEDSIRKLDLLRNNGITVALDDFGTGYSSMQYLREIPLDVIKIDKHFVDEIEFDIQGLFAYTMIQMAHDLGLNVVAEGVETERQLKKLQEHGCDYIQGYYFSRPLHEDAIAAYVGSLTADIANSNKKLKVKQSISIAIS